ncbi:MAG: glycosyltransferase family 2 protein [Immundisolibacteraceae bacterium]|nr:glycosyltransferase family 2 protein [Immundisolibacteraceae bacterium]
MIEEAFRFLLNLEGREILYYFWPFLLIDFTRYVVLDIIILAWYLPKRWREQPLRLKARAELFAERPLVSVLVPGKNEGKHLTRLANSLTKQTYKNLEIIIVDDGSDDDTPIIGRALEKAGKISRFIRNEVRGGKASAANTALQYSNGKYIVHIDADSHLDDAAIETILLPFYMDSKIGAVGGDVRVANTTVSFATRLQGIEYMKVLSVGRTVTSTLNILRIIAGAHGAFRRDILDQLRGWDVGPGLDGDLSVKIRKLGLRIVHEPHAVCYTNVPISFPRLAKQRYRWDRSMIRFRLRKHSDVFRFDANFKISNFISFVENLVFNLLLNIKWWIYTLQLIILQEFALYILIVNYFVYLMANIISFLCACVLYGKTITRKEWALFAFLPLVPIYTGIFLRLIRTFSHLMELIHKQSYRDKWNPWKVSRIAQQENL